MKLILTMLVCIYASIAHALVLEDLVKDGKLESTLSQKKIGYYIGSFDPLHLGHEDVVNQILEQNLCDYVLIYPAWGGDEYKNRTDVKIRLEMLFAAFQKHPIDYLLCHADMHGWNLIVDKESLYIVDWDTLIFAPVERDLMFIGAGIWDSGLTAAEEESLFYHGYTQTKINRDAMAYYRFERIIQDIGDYCEYIFLSDEGGDDRMQCFEHLQPVFLPNGAIERAYDSYNTRKIL